MPVALSLLTTVNAWAQAANGVWVANNSWYTIGGSMLFWKNSSLVKFLPNLFAARVHEACTRMNTEDVLWGADCAYWTNAQGGIFQYVIVISMCCLFVNVVQIPGGSC